MEFIVNLKEYFANYTIFNYHKNMVKYAVNLIKNKFYALNLPENVELEHGMLVLVRTEKGEEVAKVNKVNSQISKLWENKKPETLDYIRTLNKQDRNTLVELEKMQEEGFVKCKQLIANRKLVMTLVQCKYTFDKKKVTFYYIAPERVDFRELLKDLTQTFKRTRIDLRHIGVRDETSLMQGCGLCGREFCCCSWLRSFDSINIKLAKDQGMPVTPSKISGTCGRLLCCLNYEYKTYINAAKGLPPVGSPVMSPDGLGKVCALKILTNQIQVKLEDGKLKDYTKDELEIVDQEVNIDIDIATHYVDENDVHIDIKQLEDDRNSSTGNV